MLKKISALLLVLSLVGCASVTIPRYVKDKNPYSKKFYGEYSQVLKITSEVLEDLGWEIAGTSDPMIFEHSILDSGDQLDQIMMYTKTKQAPWFLGTTYKKLNAYVRSIGSGKSEVEIRYIRINSSFFLKLYGYKRDRLAEKIFDNIDAKLK